MRHNQNSGYGQAFLGAFPATTGKTIMLAATTDENYQMLQDLFPPDADGFQRLYNTYATAIDACTTDRGDQIIVSANFTTAPTLAQLALMDTANINVVYPFDQVGETRVAHRATATLAASALENLFAVTGLVKVTNIIGEVTTVVQTQTCNTKIHTNPTVSTDIDLCANLDITGAAVGSRFVITGTVANAMVNQAAGGGIAQAGAVLVPAGYIAYTTAATNTGAVKWMVEYEPLERGAFVIAA